MRALERTLERQRVAVPDATDRDVLGIARDGGAAVAVVMFVRDGAIVSVRDVPLPRAEGGDEDVVAAFLGQFYDAEKYVPEEVLVPAMPEDAEVFESVLSELRGTKVGIRVPQRGAQRDLLEIARKNAATTLLLLVTLYLLGRLEARLTPRHRFVYFRVEAETRPRLVDDIGRLAERVRISIHDFDLKRSDEGLRIDFALSLPDAKRDALVEGLLDLEGVRGVRVNE